MKGCVHRSSEQVVSQKESKTAHSRRPFESTHSGSATLILMGQCDVETWQETQGRQPKQHSYKLFPAVCINPLDNHTTRSFLDVFHHRQREKQRLFLSKLCETAAGFVWEMEIDHEIQKLKWFPSHTGTYSEAEHSETSGKSQTDWSDEDAEHW